MKTPHEQDEDTPPTMRAVTRPQILTAAPVAFFADGRVDYEASRKILEFIAASGTDGAFILGTTGEFPALSQQERLTVAQIGAEVFSQKRLIIHVGAASAFQAKALLADAVTIGAREVAVITPYYLSASNDAIFSFYRDVASAAAELSVYAYLFAERTGKRVSPDQLGRLANIPNLVGAKISGETIETLDAYRAAVPSSFEIFTGADRDIASVAARGVDGVVSGVSAVFPEPFVEIAAAVEREDLAGVARLQPDVDAAVDAVRGDPERIKVGLALRGVCTCTSRMALDSVDDAGRAELSRVVARYA